MITKEKRQDIIDNLVGLLEASSNVYVIDYNKMTVSYMNNLRKVMRDADVKVVVTKNSLIKKAIDDANRHKELKSMLKKQNCFLFANDNPALPGKILKSFIEEQELPEFRGAVIDGHHYDETKLELISNMRSKEDIISDIISLLMAPMQNTIGALVGVGSTLVSSLRNYEIKKQ